ncbi:MAG: hypothetical protein RR851_02730 [Clostridium sp.]
MEIWHKKALKRVGITIESSDVVDEIKLDESNNVDFFSDSIKIREAFAQICEPLKDVNHIKINEKEFRSPSIVIGNIYYILGIGRHSISITHGVERFNVNKDTFERFETASGNCSCSYAGGIYEYRDNGKKIEGSDRKVDLEVDYIRILNTLMNIAVENTSSESTPLQPWKRSDEHKQKLINYTK